MIRELYKKYMIGTKASNFPFSVFGFFGERLPKDYKDIQCPVCGYYCLGKGGFDCIDKPSLVKMQDL